MVKVEAGTFMMGPTSELEKPYHWEKPRHKVTLTKDYYIGKYEVTQALWQVVMGNNPSDFKGDNFPVEKVSWNDCQAFITKLNGMTGRKFRLPTEAEWENAARGGRKSQAYQYCGSNNISDVAWYWDNNTGMTHPVGGKLPNELGIYDMSGNVLEWCQDCMVPMLVLLKLTPKVLLVEQTVCFEAVVGMVLQVVAVYHVVVGLLLMFVATTWGFVWLFLSSNVSK